MRQTATVMARQLAASTRYAISTPPAAISSPPTPGPMTAVSVPRPKASASAPRRCSGATRFGTIAVRVIPSTEPKPASRPPRR